VNGWEELCRLAPANLRRAYDAVIDVPEPRPETPGHHRLRGSLSARAFKGKQLPQWQYEVTSAGRLWYLVDAEAHIIWLSHAGVGHPRATDR
jgi:hypothetical protein